MQNTYEVDIERMFVRLTRHRPDGFVEFEFAIGEPDLYAEMLLPASAYEAFCSINEVTKLPPRTDMHNHDAESAWHWGLRQATQQYTNQINK